MSDTKSVTFEPYKVKFKCSICGEIFEGFGNNPYPVTKGENDRCCDVCNNTKVIPARIHALMNKEAE